MTDAAAKAGVKRYFYSSSVCIYRDMAPDEPPMSEDDAIPANPDNEYGWEKLYSERVGMTYGRHSDMAVRIARFQNCYGPEGTWQGGREKAPAAMCRKVAQASEGGEVEVWGDGTAIRSYTYVEDLVDGIYRLTQSDIDKPTNIGSEDRISVKELVETVIDISGKKLGIKYVEGPVGVRSRNFKKDRIKSMGWEAKVSFREGISRTYEWVDEQVRKNF
jgi:nucleoside-diphosphate-sugar epimerase